MYVDPDNPHLGGCVKGGDPRSWEPELWRDLLNETAAQTVLDLGCGEGQSAHWFRGCGKQVTAVEGCRAAIEASPVRDEVLFHDLTTGPVPGEQEWDLAWCCEVLEHIEPRFLANALEALARCRVAAVCAAAPGHGGYHHVNCQPAEYWIGAMNAVGMVYDPGLTERCRRAGRDGGFCRERLLVFRKGT